MTLYDGCKLEFNEKKALPLRKRNIMRIYLFILISFLVSCTNHLTKSDYEQILDAAETLLNEGESLSEETSLCEALEYYRNLEPKDSTRLTQATILTAYHYWWRGDKQQAFQLLETLAVTDNSALEVLYDLASKDYDFEAAYGYMCRMLQDESARNLDNLHSLATLYFYMDRKDDCIRLFEELPQYIKTSRDSVRYFERILPNHADIISECGDIEKAIELQETVVNHFIGQDNWWVAKAYLSLARYYILQGNLEQAERHIQLCEEYADEYFTSNLSAAIHMQAVKSILFYAKYNRFDLKEWALLSNQIDENSRMKQYVNNAKEENIRNLNERNLKLTIEKQRTQIILTYVGLALLLMIAVSVFYYRRKKHQIIEKEEELEALRQLVSESQVNTEQKDDRFFKRIVLQQLGVIRMAASNPTTANQELLKRMKEITSQEVNVDALLNWKDLYQTMDYIYDGFYTSLVERFGNILNEKEIQLCCLLKANFSTKEISVVTQQSVRTVYQRKSTIRQTLEMPEGEDIISFIAKK